MIIKVNWLQDTVKIKTEQRNFLYHNFQNVSDFLERNDGNI